MPRLVRVSFDYDDTLTEPEILEYAKELIKRGFNVWIVTARPPSANKDVYGTAKDLGIRNDHVVFTGLDYKNDFIDEIKPIFHIDDDHIEIMLINSGHKTVGIRHTYNPDWKEECEEALVGYKDKNGYALTREKIKV
jgi:hydroxymethylpyrimidine pyrophosphatase-like HAD family hydrolase